MRSRQMVGNILILETAFLWSFLGIATKMVTYHGMTVTAVISLVAMLTLRVCNRGSAIRWNRQILLTALATAGQTICFFLANKYTTVANTIVLQYCSPIFVLFYYRIFQKRRLKCQQIISVAVCSAGILIFFAGQINTGMMLGNILALASGIMFGGQFYLGAMEDNDPVSANLFSQIICILITGTYAVFFAHDVFDVRQTGILVVAGFLCSGVAAVLYTRGIQMTTALNANLIASSEIIMAPIWSYLIFHETIGKWAAVGAVLMVGAILYETLFEAK